MSEISAASIIHRTDEKEYITGYWQKRSTGFANLRKAELHSDKQLLWQQENYAPPAAEPQFKNFGHWLRRRLFWHFAGAEAQRYRH